MMTEPLALYTPTILSDAMLAEGGTHDAVRWQILDELRRTPLGEVSQHHLILGGWGMGKTHLLQQLRVALSGKEDWLVVVLPEERVEISTLSALWQTCIAHLDGQEEPDGQDRLNTLLKQLAKRRQRLVLLVDRLDRMLSALGEEQWALREVLSSPFSLVLVGTGTHPVPAVYDYGEAFYDFFALHELARLSAGDATQLHSRLARQMQRTDLLSLPLERTAPLMPLLDGNPRLIGLHVEVLALSSCSDAWADLLQLLDRCSPVCRERLARLSPQGKQVLTSLALCWDPTGSGALARRTRQDVRVVAMQLDRLRRRGVVEKVVMVDPQTRRQLKRAGFQLVDRLLNLWLLVRTSPIFRQRLHRLVAFLQWMHRPTTSSPIGLETARQLCLEGRPQEAIAIARSQLMDVDLQAIEWMELRSFFSAFVQAGQAHEGVALLDDCGLSAHVEPLREALAMIAADTTGAVFAVAKEIHRIAEQLRVSLRGAAGRASRTER